MRNLTNQFFANFPILVKRPQFFLWLVIVLYFVFYSTLALVRHYTFQSGILDLGNYEQVLWNTIHGRWFAFSTFESSDNYLGYHFSPILLVPAIFYKLFPFTETILIFQTAVISFSAYLIYLLAKGWKFSNQNSILISISYLLLPSVGFLTIFDAHAAIFAIPLGLLILLFYQQRQFFWLCLCFVLMLAVKEEMALVGAAFGFVLMFNKKDRLLGLLLFVVGIIWFLSAILYIIPHFAHASYYYTGQYSYLGESTDSMVTTIFTKPFVIVKEIFSSPKLGYLTALFLPLLFLPLIAGLWSLPLVAGILPVVLNENTNLTTITYHHAAVVMAFIFYAFMASVTKYSKRFKINPSYLIKTVVCFELIILFAIIATNFLSGNNCKTHLCFRDYKNTRTQAFQNVINRIPPTASVTASNNIGSHLSKRQFTHIYPNIKDVSYIVVDKQSLGRWGMSKEESIIFNSLLGSPKYRLVTHQDDIYLFASN